jgi:pilus assembly protein TadC
MTNTREIKAAEAKLSRKYMRRYKRGLVNIVLFGILRAYALFITFWYIGHKIGTPWFVGGPATLFRMFGIVFALFAICLTAIDILALIYHLNTKYNREKIRVMMHFTK